MAESRFSVRSFLKKPVEQSKTDAVLRAGQVAPTACNLQPQRILVIRDEAALAKLKSCTKCHFDAPQALLVCYDKSLCWQRKYDGKQSGEIDAAIVTTHMMLEATNIGLGTTWVMHFDPQAVRDRFSLPETYVPVSILVMGYPAADAAPYPGHADIKPIDETVFYNTYSSDAKDEE